MDIQLGRFKPFAGPTESMRSPWSLGEAPSIPTSRTPVGASGDRERDPNYRKRHGWGCRCLHGGEVVGPGSPGSSEPRGADPLRRPQPGIGSDCSGRERCLCAPHAGAVQRACTRRADPSAHQGDQGQGGIAAVSGTPVAAMRFGSAIAEAGADLFFVQATVVSTEHIGPEGRGQPRPGSPLPRHGRSRGDRQLRHL